jgi:LacI family transcriptional regulator
MAKEKRIAVQMDIGQGFNRHTGVFAGIHDYSSQQPHWRLIIDEWADHTLAAHRSGPAPYDGFVGRISALGARHARRLSVPVVNVWFNSPARGLPGVFVDYATCGRLRAEHLIARGFRSFGVIYHAPYRASVVEADAFEAAVRQAGCEDFHRMIEGAWKGPLDRRYQSFREWRRSLQTFERWLDKLRPPVGLFVYHIDTARVIIEMCRNRSWRVPEDVAIVAGSNEETICERPEPSITSIELPYERIGFEAAQLLDRLLGRQRRSAATAAPTQILLPPVGVVARRSTDFRAVNDTLVRQTLRLIDENLHRPITLDYLADCVGVSRRTLTKHFRDKFGRTVAGEIQRLRIERVKRELAANRQPVKQIARQAGFASLRTLHAAFAREVGCSPRAFRLQSAETGPQRASLRA